MLIRFWNWLTKPQVECSSCNLLRDLLETERDDKKQILKQLLELNKPRLLETPSLEPEVKMPLSNSMPWHARQQMLEAESKRAAVLLRDVKSKIQPVTKTTEELEKELLGEGNALG